MKMKKYIILTSLIFFVIFNFFYRNYGEGKNENKQLNQDEKNILDSTIKKFIDLKLVTKRQFDNLELKQETNQKTINGSEDEIKRLTKEVHIIEKIIGKDKKIIFHYYKIKSLPYLKIYNGLISESDLNQWFETYFNFLKRQKINKLELIYLMRNS
jgi:hypothetical protein